MEIYKSFRFEAAHRLPNLPPEHKCSRLHGHSFEVEIYVTGKIDAHNGWVMDFDVIKKTFRPIYDQLDHYYLNEIEGLENPTSENIARWIWRKLKTKLPQLNKIIILETCNAGCVYCGD